MSNLRNIPTTEFSGVVITGGGVSGCAAAVGAARAGAPVLVLERGICLGGMSTGGLVAAWNGYRPEHCPITAELDRRVAKRFGADQQKALAHDAMKIVWEEYFQELKIEWRYECCVVDSEVRNEVVTGLFLAAPEGLSLLRAPVFIDASGDGVLAAAAGVPYTVGRPGDHLCQGASLSFEIGGVAPEVDIAALPQCFGQAYPVPRGELCDLAQKHLTPPAGHVLLHFASEPGVVTANMTNAVGFDPVSGKERTAAIVLCRRQIVECIRFLRDCLPGFEHCFLHRSAEQFGIRESRHFQGKATLTEADIRSCRTFPDWIAARNRFGFDVHNVAGCGADPDAALDPGEASSPGYTVPLRACLPVNRRALLLCGRNISATHLAHSSCRVMPICMNIGLGVGVTAAVALRTKCETETADIAAIQRELLAQGVSEPINHLNNP